MAATFRIPPSPPESTDAPLRSLILLQYEESTGKAVLSIPPCDGGEFHLLFRKAAEIEGKFSYSPPVRRCLAHINTHHRACSVADHLHSLGDIELPLDLRPTKRQRRANYKPTEAEIPAMQGIYPNHYNKAYLTDEVGFDAFVAAQSPPPSSAQGRDYPVMPTSMVGGVEFDAFVAVESPNPPSSAQGRDYPVMPTTMFDGVEFDAFVAVESPNLPSSAQGRDYPVMPTSMVGGVAFDAFVAMESPNPPSSAQGCDCPVMSTSMVDGVEFDASSATWWHLDLSMPGGQGQHEIAVGIEAELEQGDYQYSPSSSVPVSSYVVDQPDMYFK